MAIWSLFPDWAPSLNLGYTKLSVISSPETACERNARRKRRNENETLQDKKHKGNKKNPSWNRDVKPFYKFDIKNSTLPSYKGS